MGYRGINTEQKGSVTIAASREDSEAAMKVNFSSESNSSSSNVLYLQAYQVNRPVKPPVPNMPNIHQIRLRSSVKAVEQLRTMGIEPYFHWVPGHEGIKGNEKTDVAAKEAAESMKVPEEDTVQLAAAVKYIAR
ncbi:hypothetical protein BO70DRAFT_400221 [Aspergillus heteromorphus CBS 117.55]|uniref:Uncharacterized protein n=1 Tax=Aspergillus heteromorphus CBS 117.55 TaxID=1448321 RepID=A0A317V9B6_9EURO|nr:uncharacterized protein BO70DRAFT_400221 [Aspergillus heteromorphus CBS 117.55]PWY68590.1 hypothetical protein BO70DRAFT_400221 [Aspergillus heteromorphus CBS 117.55]